MGCDGTCTAPVPLQPQPPKTARVQSAPVRRTTAVVERFSENPPDDTKLNHLNTHVPLMARTPRPQSTTRTTYQWPHNENTRVRTAQVPTIDLSKIGQFGCQSTYETIHNSLGRDSARFHGPLRGGPQVDFDWRTNILGQPTPRSARYTAAENENIQFVSNYAKDFKGKMSRVPAACGKVAPARMMQDGLHPDGKRSWRTEYTQRFDEKHVTKHPPRPKPLVSSNVHFGNYSQTHHVSTSQEFLIQGRTPPVSHTQNTYYSRSHARTHYHTARAPRPPFRPDAATAAPPVDPRPFVDLTPRDTFFTERGAAGASRPCACERTGQANMERFISSLGRETGAAPRNAWC